MLQIIAEARPDLAESLEPFIDPAAKTIARINPPIFLNGYAFSAEDDGIFSYGDIDAVDLGMVNIVDEEGNLLITRT